MATKTTTAGGAELRAIRQEYGLTQVQLSQLAGINQGYISQIETGDRDLSPQIALKVTRALALRDELRLIRQAVTRPYSPDNGPVGGIAPVIALAFTSGGPCYAQPSAVA